MIYRRLSLFGCLMVLGCSPTTQPPPEPPATTSYISPLGLVFDMPADFTQSEDRLARVFSGPQNSNTYYTTVSLQTRAAPLQLDLALDETFAELVPTPQFVWQVRQPIFVSSTPALFYSATFEFNEALHNEAGILLVHNDMLIDLSCIAPVDMLDPGAAVCEAVLGSARIVSP